MPTNYSVTEQFVTWLTALGYSASTYPAADSSGVFITVERTGGGVVDMVDRPQIAVQAWADTEAEAEAAATAIRNEILTSSRPRGVISVFVNSGPYPFWDEYTGRPRYQLVLDCTTILN